MKKRFFLPILALGLLINSCGPIDPVTEVGEYSNVVVYSSRGVVTDYSKISISGDMSTGAFSFTLSDFKVSPDGELCNVKIPNLTQYVKDGKDIDGNYEEYYTYFKQGESTLSQGNVPVSNFYFGWLSTVYWGTFMSGEDNLWCLPRRIQTYANRTDIVDEEGKSDLENSLRPRYDLNLTISDIEHSTLSVNATSVVFPTPGSDTEKIFKFKSMMWESLPIIFNRGGFSVARMNFTPVIDNQKGNFEITDFTLRFDVSYEGTREASFYITHVESGRKIHVTTKLGFHRESLK